MPVERQPRRQTSRIVAESVAGPRNGGAAEIQRIAGRIQYHLDDVRIERLRNIVDRMAGRGDGRVGLRCKQRGHATDQRRIEQRFVALDIDHDFVVRQTKLVGGFRETIGAGRVIGARHARGNAMGRNGITYAHIVRGHDDARCAGLARAFRNTHNHRFARDIGERLAREARRGVARRYKDRERQLRHRAIRTRRGPTCVLLPRS